jgi:hypothetical protein
MLNLTITVVTSNLGDSVSTRVLVLEDLHQLLCLLLGFLLYNVAISVMGMGRAFRMTSYCSGRQWRRLLQTRPMLGP